MLRLCGLQNNGDADDGSDVKLSMGCDGCNISLFLAVVMAVEIFELNTEDDIGTGVDGNKLFGIGVILEELSSLSRCSCESSTVEDGTIMLFAICGI